MIEVAFDKNYNSEKITLIIRRKMLFTDHVTEYWLQVESKRVNT